MLKQIKDGFELQSSLKTIYHHSGVTLTEKLA